HDHKFDAISTKDYYALFGILESSNYRLARFDTITQHRKMAEQLEELRARSGPALLAAMRRAAEPTLKKADAYLLTITGSQDHVRDLGPEFLKRWRDALAQAADNESSPLFGFAKAAAAPQRPIAEVLKPVLRSWPTYEGWGDSETVVDYRKLQPQDWLPDDAT